MALRISCSLGGLPAVTQHDFAAEVLPIVLQLAFDVFQLRVELIFPRHLGGVEILVCHEKRLIEMGHVGYQSANAKKSVVLFLSRLARGGLGNGTPEIL